MILNRLYKINLLLGQLEKIMEDLPDEIILQIFEYLALDDIKNVVFLSKFFHRFFHVSYLSKIVITYDQYYNLDLKYQNDVRHIKSSKSTMNLPVNLHTLSFSNDFNRSANNLPKKIDFLID